MQSLTAHSAIFGAELCIVLSPQRHFGRASKPCEEDSKENALARFVEWCGDGRPALQNLPASEKITWDH